MDEVGIKYYSLSQTMTVSCVWMFLAELSSWVWAWPLWPGPAVPVVISQETQQSAGEQVTQTRVTS